MTKTTKVDGFTTAQPRNEAPKVETAGATNEITGVETGERRDQVARLPIAHHESEARERERTNPRKTYQEP